MTGYEKLMDFKADLQRRAVLLRTREREILTELAANEEALDEAIIQGKHHVVQERIDGLKSELTNLLRELNALEHPPMTGHLGELVRGAWTEATNEITGPLRKEWEAELTEAEKAKAMFLRAVAELGGIKRKADVISSRINEALLTLPGPKMAAPSLSTGIYEHSKTGIIYLNPQESERAFKGGK